MNTETPSPQKASPDFLCASQAIDLLMMAGWPGNLRQLCNEIQRVVARAEDGTLFTPEQLSPELLHECTYVRLRPLVQVEPERGH